MKAIVFGASGLVGGAALTALRRAGHEVVGTCLSRPKPGMVAVDMLRPGDAAVLVHELAPDAVILSAAQPHVDKCEDDPARAWRLNAEAPAEVARAAKDVGAFLAHVSTDYVFDGTGPAREDTAVNPLNTYGRAKLGAELALLSLYPAGSAVLRTTGVYGWERSGLNFILQMRLKLEAGQRMRVPFDQIGSPTSVRSLAESLVFVCENRASGLFHAVGDTAMSRIELAREACRVFEWDESLLDPVSTAELGKRAKRPLDNPLVNTRLKVLMGHGLEAPAVGLAAMRQEMDLA